MAFFTPSTDFRASDDDREQTADVLKAHYAAGRLDEAEFSARASAAYAAVFLSELDALRRDLPPLTAAAGARVAPVRVVGPSTARTPPPLTLALVGLGVLVVLTMMPETLWIAFAVLAVPLLVVLLFVVAPLALPVVAVALIARAVFRPPTPRRPRRP